MGKNKAELFPQEEGLLRHRVLILTHLLRELLAPAHDVGPSVTDLPHLWLLLPGTCRVGTSCSCSELQGMIVGFTPVSIALN